MQWTLPTPQMKRVILGQVFHEGAGGVFIFFLFLLFLVFFFFKEIARALAILEAPG